MFSMFSAKTSVIFTFYVAWGCKRAMLNPIWPVILKKISRNVILIGFQTTYECSSKQIWTNQISCSSLPFRLSKYDRISIGFAQKSHLGWQSEQGFIVYKAGCGFYICGYCVQPPDSTRDDAFSLCSVFSLCYSLTKQKKLTKEEGGQPEHTYYIITMDQWLLKVFTTEHKRFRKACFDMLFWAPSKLCFALILCQMMAQNLVLLFCFKYLSLSPNLNPKH